MTAPFATHRPQTLTTASGVHCFFWAAHSASLVRPARLQSHLRKAWSKRPAVRKLCWLQSEQLLEPGQSRRCQITGSALHTMLLLVLLLGLREVCLIRQLAAARPVQQWAAEAPANDGARWRQKQQSGLQCTCNRGQSSWRRCGAMHVSASQPPFGAHSMGFSLQPGQQPISLPACMPAAAHSHSTARAFPGGLDTRLASSAGVGSGASCRRG